jgi:HlyD family secretion protein
VNLKYCTITSPIDGIVISRNVDVGQTVAASLSAPVIFVIAKDLTKMQIDTSVAEADVGNVAVGQEVNFTVDAFPTRAFHGKVVQVRNAPVISQNVVTYDTVIQVNNDDLKLKPGMTANAAITVAQRDGALKISNAALRFRMPDAPDATPTPKPTPAGGKKFGAHPGGARGEHRSERTVYLLRDGKPQPAQIKTGISDGIFTEVLSGLKEGDVVITGMINPQAPAMPPPTNPFGGPRRF